MKAAELLEMTNTGPAELVRGELVMMSPSGSRHGRIAMRMGGLLDQFVASAGLGAVYAAETGFRISRDPDTVLAPDVAFVCKDRLGNDGGDGFFDGPPDLAVEVVSPYDRWAEVTSKVEEWLAAGAKAVWVIAARSRTIWVHTAGHATRLRDGDVVADESLLPGFQLDVRSLFDLR